MFGHVTAHEIGLRPLIGENYTNGTEAWEIVNAKVVTSVSLKTSRSTHFKIEEIYIGITERVLTTDLKEKAL